MSGLDEQRPSEGGRGADGRFMLAAMTVMLAMAGAFFIVPLLFLAPVPLAALVYRHGYRSGTVTAVVTLVLVGFTQRRMFVGMPAGISTEALQSYSLTTMIALVTIGLIGLVIGGAWREGASWRQTFWLTVGAAVFPALLAWTGAMVLYNVDLLTTLFDHWMEVVRSVVVEAERSGVGAETLQALEQAVAETEASFAVARPLFPGFMVVSAIMGAFVNVALAGIVLTRLGEQPPAIPPFVRWRWPWTLALGFILGHGLLLLSGGDGLSTTAVIGHNLLIVFNLLFAVQGAAVGWALLQRGGVGVLLRVIVLVAVYWLLPVVLIWTGVLDSWFNFRRLPQRGADADRS